MNDQYPPDAEFEEFVLTEVTRQGDYYDVRFDGCGFYVPAKEGIEPKVGSVMRQYGRGFGYPARGCFIDGQCVFYRTEDEQAEEHRRQVEEYKQKRRDELEAHRSEREAEYRALPPEFQARITRFRRNNPEFQAEHEPYETFTCREAVKIAMRLGTAEAIKEFGKAPHDEQKRLVEDISDQHSGNTFGMAVRLACLYVEHPELVEKDHGALCPLLGCRDYGCVPADAKE